MTTLPSEQNNIGVHVTNIAIVYWLEGSLRELNFKWELHVNINETNIMVFNSGSKLLQCTYGFRLGSLKIRPTRSCCYLSITFSLNE